MDNPHISRNDPCPHTEGLTYMQAIRHFRDAQHLNWTEVAVKVGLPWYTCRDWYTRVARNTVQPVCSDLITPTASWRDYMDEAVRRQDFDKTAQNWQDKGTMTLDVDRPIIVVHTSDWHLGSLATDHEHFKRWIDKMLTTDYLYMISAGVDIESRANFRSIRATLQQVLGPEMQHRLYCQIWHEILEGGKILCDCHDNHTIQQFEHQIGYAPTKLGQDMIADLTDKAVPYFRGMGDLTLTVGGQDYSYLVMHDTRFNSSFNLCHGLRQTARVVGFTGDIVVGGHIHNPAVEQGYSLLCIRTGTFKTDCEYSIRYFGQGRFAAPCVVFHPDRKEYVPFWTVEQAETYIKGCGY